MLNAHLRAFGKNSASPLEVTIQYFVAGATGFIGKRLVKKLLEREAADLVAQIAMNTSFRMFPDLRRLAVTNGFQGAFGRPVFGQGG